MRPIHEQFAIGRNGRVTVNAGGQFCYYAFLIPQLFSDLLTKMDLALENLAVAFHELDQMVQVLKLLVFRKGG
jgi:hypothetical protein